MSTTPSTPTPPTTPGPTIEAVVFDFSGVMVGSAFTAIGTGAAAHGMTEDAFVDFLLGPYDQDTDHPWHRAERGEIGILDWVTEITALAADDGRELDLGFMASMLQRMPVYDVMVDAARRTRSRGLATALLTNNIAEGRDSWRPLLPLDELFDTVVDSSEVGCRKPDPAIYRMTLDRLGVTDPATAVMLDDHPGNTAGAERVGMRSILVDDPAVAVAELDALLDGSLGG